ncbi:hypothetical protein NEHOM01_1579 [Nematocida homosporus]|uniref:uncharacterized protein n=1 Tax=Nematocida homosporus TaxID=1912981 RepID=UPI00221F2C0C|nr:uncharacterized protein NEHOM01_1579 [Nematocida homosporus]KAI5186611.1 hypothetical protein NEHOM01_1579 [Nematocida homosporus]
MRLPKALSVLLAVYTSPLKAAVCPPTKYSILQADANHAYVDPNTIMGLNKSSVCPPGYTCVPNYFMNSPQSMWPPKLLKYTKGPLAKLHSDQIYIPTTAPGGGCHGLEELDEIALRSPHNGLYLAACKDCLTTTKKIPAMIYSSFSNPLAKWKLSVIDGKCAIKNIYYDLFLTTCPDCAPARKPTILAVDAKSIDENQNTELWEVARKLDGNFTFKSAATGEYLTNCVGCFADLTTKPILTVYSTARDQSFVAWAAEIKQSDALI